MDAIFHFGMTKTGSTSIQRALSQLPNNDGKGFAYFSVDKRINCTGFLREVYGFRDSRKRPKDPSSKPSEYRDLLRQEATNSSADCWLFSSEMLMYRAEEVILDLRSNFFASHHRPRAVGYIRTPKAFMESTFQERLKRLRMNPVSLEKFLGRLYPDYREKFEKFERVFGRSSVDFWLFSPKTFRNGCVVQDFAGRIGIEIPEKYITRSNDSLSRPALYLLYVCRKYSDKLNEHGKLRGRIALIERLRALQGDKLRFHSSIVAPVLEANREDMAWMEDRLGASLAENLEADDATAIKSMDDMLVLEPQTLQWLSKELGDTQLAKEVLSGDPKIVARGLEKLAVE